MNCGGKWAEEPKTFSRFLFFPFFSFDFFYFDILIFFWEGGRGDEWTGRRDLERVGVGRQVEGRVSFVLTRDLEVRKFEQVLRMR